MNIELSKIKPSPAPIRTTWDKDKLQELAQSIDEQGLIVPIKVRPNNEIAESIVEFMRVARPGIAGAITEHPEFKNGFDKAEWEIVYGHRRAEACRIAGLDEVEAIVEGMDNRKALTQQIIENELREDVQPLDKARGYKMAVEEYGSTLAVSKATSKPESTIRYYLNLLSLPNEIIDKISLPEKDGGEAPKGKITTRHVDQVSIIPRDSQQLRIDTLSKAAKENLTSSQTRKVAESVAATKDPAMRERLINAPYSPYTHDPEYAKERADRYGEHDPMARDKTPATDEAWKLTAEVSMIVDFIKKSRQMYQEIIKMDELGKFSPEARPFFVSKLKSQIKLIEKAIEQLEG